MIKRARRKLRADADLVALIVAQLEKGGPLRDPRPDAEDRLKTSLADHVQREVQRSIDRVRLRESFKCPDAFAIKDEHGNERRIPIPKVTLADYRKVAKLSRETAAALRKVGLIEHKGLELVSTLKQVCAVERISLPELVSALERLGQYMERVKQEPPPTANAVKYFCALESFDLMSFSALSPSGYAAGPFWMIAGLIFEGVTGKRADDDPESSMKRACDLVLRDRRKLHPQAFERPRS